MFKILFVFFALCAMCFAAEGKGKAKKAKSDKPNLIIFITDDESWLERAPYGWSNLNLPNFDRVAKEGVMFTRGYSSAPSCAPARASLLTGRNFWELEQGAYIQAFLPSKIKRLPKLLEEGGYHTGYTGKGWGPGMPAPDLPDEKNPAGKVYQSKKRKTLKGMSDIDYPENFKHFLEENKDGKPFMFWVGSIEPHSPYPPDAVERLEKEKGITLDKVNMPPFIPKEQFEKEQKIRASVWYELHRADEDLGRILKILEERGELENTIILVTGDNGTQISFSKATPYDWGVHVPFLMMWPSKVAGGRVVDDFVNFRDIAPTFLDAAKLPIPAEMSGRTLLPILTSGKSGRVEADRSFIVTGLEWHGELPPYNSAARAIRDENFEYIINYAKRPANRVPPHCIELQSNASKDGWEELYDVKNDPWTQKNLAADPKYAEVKEKMKAKLREYQLKTQDPRATGKMEIFDATRKIVEGRKASGYSKE